MRGRTGGSDDPVSKAADLSAGKSVGEIAWRRSEGIGSRGHVVGWLERRSLDTSASVRRQKEKRGV